MLEVTDLDVYYGHVHAVKGVSFSIEDGRITTIIGANGAGKSTIIKAIVGSVKPRSGDIKFGGQSMRNVAAHEFISRGIGYVPERRRLFPAITVEENLMMGYFSRRRERGLKQQLDRVYSIFPAVQLLRKQLAGKLSGGEQQMVTIGRALMSNPRLLLMDEPSLGLAPRIVDDVFRLISSLNEQGLTVLLVEQNALGALEISHAGLVLRTGSVVMSGPARDLLDDPMVKEAYLGM